MNNDFIHDALRLMREDGLLVDNPIAEGQLHRCAVDGKERARDGAYIIHSDKNVRMVEKLENRHREQSLRKGAREDNAETAQGLCSFCEAVQGKGHKTA